MTHSSRNKRPLRWGFFLWNEGLFLRFALAFGLPLVTIFSATACTAFLESTLPDLYYAPQDEKWSEHALDDRVTFSLPDDIASSLHRYPGGERCEATLFRIAPTLHLQYDVRIAIFGITHISKGHAQEYLRTNIEYGHPIYYYRIQEGFLYAILLNTGEHEDIVLTCLLPKPYFKYRAIYFWKHDPLFFAKVETVLSRITSSVKIEGRTVFPSSEIDFEYREQDPLFDRYKQFNEAFIMGKSGIPF